MVKFIAYIQCMRSFYVCLDIGICTGKICFQYKSYDKHPKITSARLYVTQGSLLESQGMTAAIDFCDHCVSAIWTPRPMIPAVPEP